MIFFTSTSISLLHILELGNQKGAQRRPHFDGHRFPAVPRADCKAHRPRHQPACPSLHHPRQALRHSPGNSTHALPSPPPRAPCPAGAHGGKGQGARAGSGKQHRDLRAAVPHPYRQTNWMSVSPCPSEMQGPWRPPLSPLKLSVMIVTHTQNAQGQRRLYLGGKSSLECWIEPDQDGACWTFHALDAVTGNALNEEERRACMAYYLLGLAREMGILPLDLAQTPFEALAATHTSNPLDCRRVAMPRSKTVEHGFMATTPNIRRPATDFSTRDSEHYRRR